MERAVDHLHLLLIERDSTIRQKLVEEMQQQEIYVTALSTVLQAKESLEQNSFDAAMINSELADGSGIDLLHLLRKQYPAMHCIICSEDTDPELPVAALRAGAVDFIHYPPSPGLIQERLAALPVTDRSSTPISTPKKSPTKPTTTKTVELLGEAPAIAKLRAMITRLHDANSTILITGESGTGKEVIARSLHQSGQRAEQPFVSINCGAIPEELLESELFGHVKGSFTGATRTRQGRFAIANGGTIFLDEIGDMVPKLQVKLLRVLQEHCFEPVGSHESVHIDVRVIAATHCDLEQAIAEGRFRQDLFYRLNVIPLEIPPLRDRGNDIFLLADAFIKHFNKRLSANLTEIDDEAKEAMRNHSWPGNVRELQNLIERIATLKQSGAITLEDLPSRMLNREQRILQDFIPTPSYDDSDCIDFKQLVDGFERHLLLMALNRFNWNKNRAAAHLSMNRTTLFEKIKKKALTPPPCSS
ncbi:MAG: sigma-54 dependent transcriptional regulator [Mariprofundales bacterium]|nr:sigma-54 dependent transcriptional regulator [Mariprofundales bacterium]